MVHSIFQRIKYAGSRLLGTPAFRYEESDAFLGRFVRSQWPDYEAWLERHRHFTRPGLEALWNQARRFRKKPLISVLMPVYNPDPAELWQAVESLLWQAYPHWELCIADDRSTNREYLRVLGRLRDRRVRIRLNQVHAGIAGTSQAALDLASGDYVALMDQDDELSPDALFAFVQALQEQEIDYFYSDRDMISPGGRRHMHFLKPGWSPEYLLSFNYCCHLEIYRKGFVQAAGSFRPGYEGSQDYDLLLRATDQPCRIYHHPMVLYSWRQSRGSVATDLDAKGYAFEAGVRAVRETARRRGLPVREVIENPALWRGHYRLLWDESRLRDRQLTFLLVGGGEDEAQRLTGLCRGLAAGFPACEIVRTGGGSEELREQCRRLAPGGLVFFCTPAVLRVLSSDFFDMVGYLGMQGVGAVGCKFLYGDGAVCNAGLAVASSGKVLYLHRGRPAADAGYGAIAAVPKNASLLFPAFWGGRADAVRELWPAGAERSYFASVLHFCKELRRTGRRIVSLPSPCLEVVQEEKDHEEDLLAFARQWRAEGLADPYYNTNLTDSSGDCGLLL